MIILTTHLIIMMLIIMLIMIMLIILITHTSYICSYIYIYIYVYMYIYIMKDYLPPAAAFAGPVPGHELARAAPARAAGPE